MRGGRVRLGARLAGLTYNEKFLIEDKVDGVAMNVQTSLASGGSQGVSLSRASYFPRTPPTTPRDLRAPVHVSLSGAHVVQSRKDLDPGKSPGPN
jgi:hypothetical protein